MEMHEIKQSKVLVILAAVITLGFLAIAGFLFLMNQNKTISADSAVQGEQIAQITITVKENNNQKNFKATLKEGDILLDTLTKLAAANEGFSFGMKETAYGPFLSTLNGVEALDSKKEFWQFNVNGIEASEGIGSYKTKAGDTIEFVLTNY